MLKQENQVVEMLVYCKKYYWINCIKVLFTGKPEESTHIHSWIKAAPGGVSLKKKGVLYISQYSQKNICG